MRTIKFRGKRCDNGEWIYGYYVSNDALHVFGLMHLILIAIFL